MHHMVASVMIGQHRNGLAGEVYQTCLIQSECYGVMTLHILPADTVLGRCKRRTKHLSPAFHQTFF